MRATSYLALGLLMTIAHSASAAAQAMSLPVGDPSVPSVLTQDYPRSKAQDLDLASQSRQTTIEFATAAQMLRTMVKPRAPQILQCDPRTLPDAQRAAQADGHNPSPDELVLGQPGKAVIADQIYFAGTSDGRQCPPVGSSINLPAFFNEVQH
ncbi:hypothetical protein [Sphingomonas sp. GB1N7]|uniref:hypothetical protein n=1 Tax=Parasphingomonas caseinilytica TaxID=3096158 RepID=UPI002FCCA444